MADFLELYKLILWYPAAWFCLATIAVAETVRGHVAAVLFSVFMFLPFIHDVVGERYFNHLCTHEAGVFVYRTVSDVQGILQVRPSEKIQNDLRRPSPTVTPEDSHGDFRWPMRRFRDEYAEPPWSAYRYFEVLGASEPYPWSSQDIDGRVTVEVDPEAAILHYVRAEKGAPVKLGALTLHEPQSKHGLTWGKRPTVLQGFLKIVPGEIRVFDIRTSELLGVSRQFFHGPTERYCPRTKEAVQPYAFVEMVLRPAP